MDNTPVTSSSVRFVYTKWELETMSPNMKKSLYRAEHNHMIKQQLGKLQMKTSAQTLQGRQKYSKVLGVLGYEQLPLKPLAPVDMTRERRTQRLSILENKEIDAIQLEQTTIKDYMRAIVSEISQVNWLSDFEQDEMTNAFITDLASRYNDFQNIMDPHLSPKNNKKLLFFVFTKIKDIKDYAIEACHRKKSKMDQKAIFTEQMNSGRMVSYFRMELCQRINIAEIVRFAMHELEGILDLGHEIAPTDEYKQDEVMDMQMALTRISKGAPKDLLPPPPKLQQDYWHRQRASMDSSMGLKKAMRGNFRRIIGDVGKLQSTSSSIFSKYKKNYFYDEVLHDLSSMMRRTSIHPDISKEESDEDSEGEEIAWLNDSSAESKGQPEIFDNALLRAHAEMSHSAAKSNLNSTEIKIKNSARYLPASKFFEYDVLQSTQDMDPDDEDLCEVEKNYTELTMPDGSLARSINTKISDRDNYESISLELGHHTFTQDIQVISESQEMDVWDENLKRFKEVEELYDEIMKTIVGDHLQTSEGEDNSMFACPSAPGDQFGNYTATFKGFKVNFVTLEGEDVKKQDSIKKTEDKFSPTVKLRVRAAEGGVSVSPIDYQIDRKNAMKLTPSSKYRTFKHNYGGYIPYDIDEKQKTISSGHMGMDDYKKYLRARFCDFLPDLIMADEAKAEEDALNESEVKLRIEIEKKAKAKAEKVEKKKKEIFTYKKGEWKIGVLNVMARTTPDSKIRPVKKELSIKEVSKPPIIEEPPSNTPVASSQPNYDPPQVPLENSSSNEPKIIVDTIINEANPIVTTIQDASSESTHIIPIIQDASFVSTPVANISQTPSDTKADTASDAQKSPDIIDTDLKEEAVVEEKQFEMADDDLIPEDLTAPQTKLEKIWKHLKMPVDQKLDMAIKYGHHRFTKMDLAVELWTQAAKLIIGREKILHEIEKFERAAIHPELIFKRLDVPIDLQIKETSQRESLLKKLHFTEARLEDATNKVKRELRETVTYNGVPIFEKMKHDYSEMMKRVAEYRATAPLVVPARTKSPGRSRSKTRKKTTKRSESEKNEKSKRSASKTESTSSSVIEPTAAPKVKRHMSFLEMERGQGVPTDIREAFSPNSFYSMDASVGPERALERRRSSTEKRSSFSVDASASVEKWQQILSMSRNTSKSPERLNREPSKSSERLSRESSKSPERLNREMSSSSSAGRKA